MSKRAMSGSSSSSSTRQSSSMATFFPDRVQPRRSVPVSHNNGHSHRTSSTNPPPATSPPKSSGNSNGNLSKDYKKPSHSRFDKHPLNNTHIDHRDHRPSSSISTNPEGDSRSKFRSYQVMYDPELSKSKSKGTRPIHRYNGNDAPTPTDPRIEGQTRYTRTSKGKKALTTALPIPKFSVCCLIYLSQHWSTNFE